METMNPSEIEAALDIAQTVQERVAFKSPYLPSENEQKLARLCEHQAAVIEGLTKIANDAKGLCNTIKAEGGKGYLVHGLTDDLAKNIEAWTEKQQIAALEAELEQVKGGKT